MLLYNIIKIFQNMKEKLVAKYRFYTSDDLHFC